MSVTNRSGRRKILKKRGDIPQTTLLTKDSWDIMLTREGLIGISNYISEITGSTVL